MIFAKKLSVFNEDGAIVEYVPQSDKNNVVITSLDTDVKHLFTKIKATLLAPCDNVLFVTFDHAMEVEDVAQVIENITRYLKSQINSVLYIGDVSQ